MKLVVLYGPPGVGKFTIGKELAAHLDFQLFDNHSSSNCVRSAIGSDSPYFGETLYVIRLNCIRAAVKTGILGMIFTCSYEHPRDYEFISSLSTMISGHDSSICFIKLTCQHDLLAERIASPERKLKSKTTDTNSIERYFQKTDANFMIPHEYSYILDTSNASAKELARATVKLFIKPEANDL